MYTAVDQLKQLFPEQYHERIFLVGGSVRDCLTGRPGKDIDLAAALSDQEFAAFGFRPVTGKSTVPIWFRHDALIGTIEAIQLESIDALQEDLLRRDFSINAIAINLSGKLSDPMEGHADLEAGVLRACSSSTFRDDPLRIFRAFRFEADGWRMPAVTEDLIKESDWTQAFTGIPVERFSREMLKAIGARQPELYFQRMLEFGVGSVYLPELFRMPEIPAGPLIHHPEGDLFNHSTQVLLSVAGQTDDPLVRFCAFFHDIGKLATDPALYPKHYGHDQAGYKLAFSFCDRLRLPAAYRTSLAWVSRLHTTLNLWEDLRNSTKLRLVEQAIKAGIANILPIVSNADKAGAFNLEEWVNTLHIAGMSATELGIDVAYLENLQATKRNDFILQKRIQKLLDII